MSGVGVGPITGVEKCHLLRCDLANCGQLQVDSDNIRQIVNVDSYRMLAMHRCALLRITP